jgi:hypothetical protein
LGNRHPNAIAICHTPTKCAHYTNNAGNGNIADWEKGVNTAEFRDDVFSSISNINEITSMISGIQSLIRRNCKQELYPIQPEKCQTRKGVVVMVVDVA